MFTDEEEWAASAAPISNVYAAGEGSALFSLSLPRVFQRGVVDFSRVEGLPGVFLANQLAPEALEEQHAFEYLRWISTKVDSHQIWKSQRLVSSQAGS